MKFETVASLLKDKKSSELVTVAPSVPVAEAVRAMNSANVGAVLVMDGQKLAGIFTERDLMVRVVGAARDPATTPVSAVMTSEVRCVELNTPVEEAMRLMSDRRHRHLPVQENGKVHGVVSIGDLTRQVILSQQEHFDGAIRAVREMGMSNRRG